MHHISHPCYQACAHRFVLVVTRRDAAVQPSHLVHASRAARCRARVAIAVVRPADSASASQSTRRNNIAWCCCRVVDSTSSNSHRHVSVAVTPSGLGISKYGPTTAAERLSCVTALRGGVLSSTDACVRRRRHEIVCFGLKWHMATLIRWSDGSISDCTATVTSLAELYGVYELGYAACTRQH
jgi:hypothetical protein